MNLSIKTKKIAIFFGLFFLFSMASAQGIVHCGNPDQEPCTLVDLFILVGNVIDFLLLNLLIPLAVLWVTIAGVTMVTSAGDPTKFEKAKKMLFYSVVGVLVALMSFIIVETFVKTLKGESLWILRWFQ
jgi:hypothetical protein